jgi:hypothetical protein
MAKWADYLISKVSYDPNRLITFVVRHKDTEQGITPGILVDRTTLSSDIKKGLSHITIYTRNDSWKKGYGLKFFSKDGNHYLRIDGNKVKLDYLGDLPEAQPIELKPKPSPEPKPKPEPITESEPKPAPELKRPKGALPKESSEELPQELDLAPEPKPEPKPAPELKRPKGALPKESSEELPQELDLAPEPITEPDEDVTDQLLRLEQLEKQLNELESKPKPEPKPEPALELKRPKGTLPKESSEELPQELDLAPEPITESKPKTTKPKATKPKTTKPKATKPKTTKPKATKPKTESD